MRPNVFIIGAPRSGTSSLFFYLKQHPQIFMSSPKEPDFFSEDLTRGLKICDEAAYLSLFEGATEDHLAIGEASTWYLSSEVAPQRLHHFNPQARILALFRNPVEVVESLHQRLRLVGWEDEPDLASAIALQERRLSGECLPKQCPSPGIVHYTRVARHAANLERWLAVFPKEQICGILFDDFVRSPQDAYRQVLEFIAVPDDGRSDFPRRNEGRPPREGRVASALRTPTGPIQLAGRAARRVLRAMGVNDSAMVRGLWVLNSRSGPRSEMDRALREQLVETFRTDIERLSVLLGRDLSTWLHTPEAPAADRCYVDV